MALGAALLLFSSPCTTMAQTPGILGQTAPRWDATDWIQVKGHRKSLEIDELKGKVVVLFCFQAWCPGCHAYGFPVLQKLVKHYEKDSEVQFAAVQTVFEGFGANTVARGHTCARKFDLEIPFGHSGKRGEVSRLMQRYRTGGTPWTIIIGKGRKVRFNDFRIDRAQAIRLIDRLKGE